MQLTKEQCGPYIRLSVIRLKIILSSILTARMINNTTIIYP